MREGDRTYAMLIHLSAFLGYAIFILAPVVTLTLWLAKRNESPFVDDHGREAVNFAISMWLYTLLSVLLILVCVGWLMLAFLAVFEIVVVIIAAVRASSGGFYRYPITIRFIRA